jgi:hypothetical protein
VDPKIPEGMTIENLDPLYETDADGPVVMLTEDPENEKVGSGTGVGLALLPTVSQRKESSPSSSNANPLTACPLEHISEDENLEEDVSFWTDNSEKSEPPLDTNNELIPHS